MRKLFKKLYGYYIIRTRLFKALKHANIITSSFPNQKDAEGFVAFLREKMKVDPLYQQGKQNTRKA
jgi:hypothetical protein